MQELEEYARCFLNQFETPDKRLDEPKHAEIDLDSFLTDAAKYAAKWKPRNAEFNNAPDPEWVRQYYEPVNIPFQEGAATVTVVCNNPYAAVTAVQDPTMDAMDARIHDLEAQLQSLMDERGRYL